MTNMHSRTGWKRISCAERDEHYGIAGDHLKPLSSLTDLDGVYGAPVIFTEWGRDDSDEPLLRDYRYPSTESELRGYPEIGSRCEHYFYIGQERGNALTEES